MLCSVERECFAALSSALLRNNRVLPARRIAVKDTVNNKQVVWTSGLTDTNIYTNALAKPVQSTGFRSRHNALDLLPSRVLVSLVTAGDNMTATTA
jgi:hypothetical protein